MRMEQKCAVFAGSPGSVSSWYACAVSGSKESAGLRISEALALTREDVTVTQDSLAVAAPYFLGPTISKRYTTLRDATDVVTLHQEILAEATRRSYIPADAWDGLHAFASQKGSSAALKKARALSDALRSP